MGRPLRRRLRARLGVALLRLLAALLRPVSWATVQRVGRALGTLGWLLAGRDRRRTLHHLALAFSHLSPRERRALGLACFRHQGTNLTECLYLLSHDCRVVFQQVEVEGWENVEAVRAAGRPVFILTGHCGNWELLGATMNCRKLGLATVARPLNDPEFQELILEYRDRYGTETIERGTAAAARKLLQVFRTGRALCMLIDQDTRVEGVWVSFFGRPAYTPVGAAKFALRQDAAVIPAFIERRPDGTHLARFLPPLDLPPDPEEATALMTRSIEEQVRRRPEQWVWMHRRWRRQPEGKSEATQVDGLSGVD